MQLPHDTVLFLPHWWVEIFKRATVLHTTGAEPDAYVGAAKFLPYLQPLALKLCSHIIGIVQQQLLANASATITIPLAGIYNELQLLNRRQRRQAQLLLHELRSFRLLQTQDDGMQAWPLFTDEIWRGAGASLQVELQLAPWGRELLLGYCEPYADFVRCARQQLQLRLHCASAPLHLWKSVWLDMQGVEQLIYLRLEEAAQRYGNWLNLEHTLCQSLPEVCSGLQCSEHELLRLLTTLGKKLTEHGYVLPQTTPRAVFLDTQQQQQTQLLWTLQSYPTVQHNRHAWQTAVCAHLCQQQLAETLTELLAVLVPDRRRRHQKLLDSFTALLSRIDSATDIGVLTMLTPACPLLDIALFFEWSLRRLLPNLSLPQNLVSSSVAAALDSDSSMPLHTRFANFRRWLKEQPHFVQELRSTSQACLVNTASLSIPTPTRQQQSQPRPQAPVATTPTKSPEPPSGNKHLHKLANLELQKILARSRTEYNKLERSYLDSLSPATRQSILEVKKHMQASIFENHLRPRIISFMIANPSSWQRTEAVKDLRVFD